MASKSTPSLFPALRLGVGYMLMLGVGIGSIFLVATAGSSLSAPAPAPNELQHAARSSSPHTLLHVLLTLAVVVVAARGLGLIARYFRQPPVIGEVIAGIALGPSLLGRIAPDVSNVLLPASAAPHVGMIAQVGVIIYMFLVGLELDTRAFRGRTHTSIAVSHASILLPFTLGAVLALALYPRFSSSNIAFVPFALFIGVSMSVTAFPVLTRILGDLQLMSTRLGTIAVACAAVDDVTAWCLLAFVVAVAGAAPEQALVTILASAAYLAAMLLVVRPLIQGFARRKEAETLSQNSFAVICIALLCSALLTELIGIHALFGAFLLGTMIPHDSRLGIALREKLSDLVVVLFLPAFFAFTGLRTQISLLQGTSDWLWCAAVVGVASLGKLGGSAAAARLTGLGWRESVALGALMNTRGLMELIILNVALDLGILTPKLFAIFVIMALVTTIATTPLLHWIYGTEVSQNLPDGELASG